ncbi:MAG: NAD-dependent epimerase/dehydratase family protein, partial [Candidatus Eremiobacteraeota bacterium]|nr:NAD-dependent epimerase/dehydratase family protein [Candidatus Eremiobacteraeota bacterium]
MKLTIAGGSGFVGRHLAAALGARGDAVKVTSLRDMDKAARYCAGADVVVNLAGAPIAKRWTRAYKLEIRRSRVELTRALIERIARFDRKPMAYVSASAIGYYGMSRTETFIETSLHGDDFLARVCVEWEHEAGRASELGIRVAIVRSGIAL